MKNQTCFNLEKIAEKYIAEKTGFPSCHDEISGFWTLFVECTKVPNPMLRTTVPEVYKIVYTVIDVTGKETVLAEQKIHEQTADNPAFEFTTQSLIQRTVYSFIRPFVAR